jgi:membrane associated rhomboid family serine protease
MNDHDTQHEPGAPDRPPAPPPSDVPPPPASTWVHPPQHLGPPHRRSRFSIVTAIIAVNLAIFAVGVVARDYYNRTFYNYGVLVPYLVAHGQLWRLVTAQYLHASTLHLFVNMIALHFLGRPLEEKWSARRFFTIYTVCGMVGNVFYVVLADRGVINPGMPAVGASGSLYGLLGIVAVQFPHAEFLLFFVIPIRIRTAAVILGIVSFMTVVQRGGNYGGEACHLAGLAFGVWWAVHGEEWWATTEWAWKRPRDKPPR